MDNFESAMKVVFGHEGGIADDPDDHGGFTNMGLTLGFLNQMANPELYVKHPAPWTKEDLEHMPRTMAYQIYKDAIWDRNGYGNIKDVLVATKVFDQAVNMGEFWGEKLTQRAVNRLGYQPALMVDGNLGPKSYEAINSLDRTELLLAMRKTAEDFYESILQKDPTQEKFRHAWMSRAEWPF
jgi:type VI secretion system secreted protein VgrG